jgi:hypothetical protein
MADPKVTPTHQSMGFSIAAIVLATSVLDASIRRGDITAAGAKDVISNALIFLQKRPPGVPDEALVFGVAARALQLAEAFLAMAAAERPPQGHH